MLSRMGQQVVAARRWQRATAWFAAGVIVALALPAGAQSLGGLGFGGSAAKEPDHPVTASMVASVTAVAPGASFELAVTLKMQDGWHVYWKNPGDSGLPTEVAVTAPDGFEVGDVRYPAPLRFVTPPSDVSFGYEHSVSLLISVKAPEVIDGETVIFRSTGSWLACKELCTPGEAELQIELPVRPADQVSPANVDLLATARGKMPQFGDDDLSAVFALSVDRIRPSDSVPAAVVVDIRRDKDLAPEGAPELFFEEVEGLRFGDSVLSEAEAPDGRQRSILRMTVTADGDLSGSTRVVRGVVTFQLAGEQARAVEFESVVSLAAAGDAVAAANSELFGAVVVESGTDAFGMLERLGLFGLLVACALYGLALNATPCVLPILSIKVVGFVQQAGERRGRAVGLGVAFAIGVVLLFVALGLMAAAGRNVLQYPSVVIGLGAVVMALALSMLGVYTLRAPSVASDLDGKLGRGETLLASFGKGLLAPILGFACTGPLMAGALAWAARQPGGVAVLAFSVMGLGMAAPYVLLAAFPGWQRMLPKPGNWMITFERIVAFGLLAAVVWLMHPLVRQIGPAGLEWTLVFLVAVGAGCWVLGKSGPGASDAQRWRSRVTAAGIVLVSGLVIYGWAYPLDAAVERQRQLRLAGSGGGWSVGIPWRPYSGKAVAEAVADGNVVFVDFTADYCSICKKNLALVIDTEQVRGAMQRLGVIPFEADLSSPNPEATAALRSFGRAALPLYLVYSPDRPDAPVVLPPEITKAMLIEAFEAAMPAANSSSAPSSSEG